MSRSRGGRKWNAAGEIVAYDAYVCLARCKDNAKISVPALDRYVLANASFFELPACRPRCPLRRPCGLGVVSARRCGRNPASLRGWRFSGEKRWLEVVINVQLV
jgi:hypothetical protein